MIYIISSICLSNKETLEDGAMFLQSCKIVYGNGELVIPFFTLEIRTLNVHFFQIGQEEIFYKKVPCMC